MRKVFYFPEKIEVPINVNEIYDKLRTINKNNIPIKKVSFDKISTHSYMWHTTNIDIQDDIDIEFIKDKNKYKIIGELYHYSDHSNYHGIVRFMLMDVIKIGTMNNIFKNHDVIYVKSVLCNRLGKETNNIYESYSESYGHLTKTVYLAKIKENNNNEPAKKRICLSNNDNIKLINEKLLEIKKLLTKIK